ncbi:LrgB-like family [Novosphingobium nitrogenifigens DSM 19370]|uniref:LrgB-like family n=1 Tax=Novosphingobium nitrogenifigens DSM 19370 TaxID=983920 RepID=F1Z8F2_9SPHN|nr:LrgB family protein [Novosphingobium nitrogenifigens]EGD59073.1 LrgB-like family [Novosphingobium nitrogenifigens DSM 19370]
MNALGGLLSTQLFWLAVTLTVFAGADALSLRSRRHPLCHPVLLATPALIVLIRLSGVTYATYSGATSVLGFLLGPAVVGLAVPIHARLGLIRRLALPLFLALLAGSLTAIVSAVGILWLFGGPPDLLATIAPRATTTPVAMELARQLGGRPSLAAALVLGAGVIGAMVATPLLNALGVRDMRARGFAVGVSAHGFGAARAFQVSETAGAFASLGMALNAVATALIILLFAVLA